MAVRADLCLEVFFFFAFCNSQLPLEVERLLHVVLATAQGHEAGVGARRHAGLVLLLQLHSTLQVLVASGGVGQFGGFFFFFNSYF